MGKARAGDPLDFFAAARKRGELLTIEEASGVSGFSKQHLARLCLARKLRHVRRRADNAGKPLYFVFRSDLSRFVRVVEPK